MTKPHANLSHKPSFQPPAYFSLDPTFVHMDEARKAFLKAYVDWLISSFPTKAEAEAEAAGTLLCLQQMETLLRRGGIIRGR